MSADAMGAGSGGQDDSAEVPDFAAEGFGGGGESSAAAVMTTLDVGSAHAQIPDLQALSVSGCVGVSYNAAKNRLCVQIPIYGSVCVPSPVKIPIGAKLQGCFSTCGVIIPTGVKLSIRLNGKVIVSKTFGFC